MALFGVNVFKKSTGKLAVPDFPKSNLTLDLVLHVAI